MLNILSKTLGDLRATCLRITSPRREVMRDLPPQLYDYWSRTAHLEFKGIPRDAFFYARAAEALVTFFECVARTGHPCALPSKAADSVWHAWLRHSPASLDDFCERHFGMRIPHVEAADMAGGMALPIARTLVMARRLDGLDPAGPSVPRLFGTDRALRMPGGFAYEVRGNRMVHSRMNRSGRPVRAWRVHPATEPDFLLAAGMITQGHYEWWQLQCGRAEANGRAASPTEGACCVACEIATSGGDSGSSDGGSSCGSSCGSGCGGGGCGS